MSVDKLVELYKKRKFETAFINLRPLLGNFNWAEFLFLIGGAQAGKSYAIIDFFVSQFMEHGTPFYWFRLTEAQCKILLQGNASKLIDPDIRRRYNLELVTNGNEVFVTEYKEKTIKKKNGDIEVKQVEDKKKRRLLARVLPLSVFYKQKGAGYFDKDYDGWYNIGLDEFQPEKGEKRTFDIVYAFVRSMENIARNTDGIKTKARLRVIAAANLLEEASEILSCFEFLPETFGTYRLKKKRCVISYIEPTEKYKEMRKGSVADILLPNASMYSNKQNIDYSLVYKGPLHRPTNVIKFTKDENTWFTIWDSKVICKYNKEKQPIIAMRPYIDELFMPEMQKNIVALFDTRAFVFRNLITFKLFQSQLEQLKPRA